MNRLLRFLQRYAFAWAVVCGLPLAVARIVFGLSFLTDIWALNTTLASSVALFLGLYITGQLSAFPGTRSGEQGVPAVIAGYAIVLVALLMFRIPYSVTFLLYSLGATAGLMLVFTSLFSDRPRNNFYVVPSANLQDLADLEGVTFFVMDRPELPADPRASIVADLRADVAPEWERMMATAALRGIPVYHYKFLHESIAGKVKIEHLSENTLGSLTPNQIFGEAKLLVDRLLAAVLLPLFLPVFAVVALIIKLQDGGDVFYRQQRVGRGGKPFQIFKFRSMTSVPAASHADDCRDTAITLENDKRITRFGAFIRRYRIDELPQIINVLRGEMSFVGPRPEVISLGHWYEMELPFYSYRHIVLPGLTGWAQVNQGHVTDIADADHKLQYDFYYIKYFSAWLDILIVLKTVKIILTGFGSK